MTIPARVPRNMLNFLRRAVEGAREDAIIAEDPTIRRNQIGHTYLPRPGYYDTPSGEIGVRIFVETDVPATFTRVEDDDFIYEIAEIDADAIRDTLQSRDGSVTNDEIEWAWQNRPDETETQRQGRR